MLSAVALLFAAQIGKWKTIGLWEVTCFAFISISLCVGIRLISRVYLRILRRKGKFLKTLLIVGGGSRGERFARQIRARTDLGYKILGFIDSDAGYSHKRLAGSPWLGTVDDLPAIISREVIDDVAIALPIKSSYSQIRTVIELLEEQGVGIHLLSDFFPRQFAKCQALKFEGEPLTFFHSAPFFNWRTEVKRIIDLIGAVLLLIFLLPLLLIVAILIKLDSEGPVFFVQERVGYNKRRFGMIKFRTMVEDAEDRLKDIEHLNEKEGPIFKIRNDPRITRLGRFLRKSSIDELPQLINIVLGEMSLVGPRPLSSRDADKLEEAWHKRRFSVKPGMTCLWQISGRSELSFEKWMQLDLEYIDRWSLLLDWWILIKTIPAVIISRGAV